MDLSKRLIVMVLIGGLLMGCQQSAPEAEKPVPVVKTQKLAELVAYPDWQLTGTVEARYVSNLAFRVGGKIIQRAVNRGDGVEAHQVLFQLDPTDYQLSLEVASANVQGMQSQISNAKSELLRLQKLALRNLTSEQSVEQAKNQLTVYQAQLQSLLLQEKQARNQLAYATLKSPGLGEILALHVEQGEVITAGQPVVALAMAGHREVVVQVPENRRNTLPKIASVVIYGQTEVYPVELREMASQADSVSRTWQANYVISTADAAKQVEIDSFRLGQTATITFASPDVGVRVPNTALYEQGDFTAIWSVQEGKVHRVPVKVQSLSAQWAWIQPIEGDFSQVKTLVTLGVHLLTEGQAVKESAE